MSQTISYTETAQPPLKVFPADGTNLSKILNDANHRQSFHKQLKRWNPWMAAFYRIGLLPLFGASRNMMLLTTRGKKSGKLRSTPIGYFRIGGVVHLFSAWGKGTAWYKNLTAHPDEVWIQIGMRKRPVTAQVLADRAEILRTLDQFIRESPEQAKYLFGWEPGKDTMAQADFSPVLERVLIVRFVEKKG